MKNLKILSKWIRPHRTGFIISLLLILLLTYSRSIIPQFTSYAIDTILLGNESAAFPNIFDDIVQVADNPSDQLVRLIIVLLVFQSIRALIMITSSYIQSIANEGIMFNLRNTLYLHIQRLPYSYFKNNNSGDLIQRCTTDVDAIRVFLTNELRTIFWLVSIILTIIFTMLMIDVKFTLISLILTPFIFLTSFIYFRSLKTNYEKFDHAEGELTSTIRESVIGIPVIKAFGAQKYELDKFNEKSTNFYTILQGIFNRLSALHTITTILSLTQTLLVMLAGVYLLSKDLTTVGTLILFLSYVRILSMQFRALGRLFANAGRVFVAISQVNDIFEVEEETIEDLTPDLVGTIKFNNVCFNYEDSPVNVLKNVSFEIMPGEKVAIIGKTGSGKSTVAQLLTRMFEPTSGSITINGYDISQINKHYLRRNIGFVEQEPYLFAKDIKRNIAIAKPNAEMENIIYYAQTAHVHDDIINFPESYETVVGERGITLSGGQKQRVAIARMLINDNKIMIFDDSLSAVDNETDYSIRKSLGNQKLLTTITITHRITSILDCERVIVIDNGEIIENGTIEELKLSGGYFQNLYEKQIGGDQDE